MTTETLWDWSQAQLTKSAQNAKEADRRRMIRVPRASLSLYNDAAWDRLEEDASAGRNGAEQWLIYGNDTAPNGFAYLREGTKAERSLLGRCLLYSQGW